MVGEAVGVGRLHQRILEKGIRSASTGCPLDTDHKEVMMKKHAIPAFAVLGLAVMLVAKPASAQSSAMRVSIPFEFTVGKTTLPAGQYQVKMSSTGAGFLTIQGLDCAKSVVVLTNSSYANRTANESQLVFNRYGSHYFLSRIWTEGTDIGCELHRSPAEREIRRAYSLAQTDEARTVAIAANRN